MADFAKEVSDADFEAEVLQAGEPVLVDFWAEWCGPCRMIAPTVEAVAEQVAGKAKVFKMNVDFNLQVPQKYGIRGIPTLILFKGGEEKERIVGGGVTREKLAALIESHV
jgi:thioredoxin 1